MYASNATSIAQEKPPTAAQEALGRMEGLVAELREIERRVEVVAEHLGVNVPETAGMDSAKVPRPVRSGVIGAIHETADTGHNVVQNIGHMLARIERQV